MRKSLSYVLSLALIFGILTGCASSHTKARLFDFVGEPVIWSAKEGGAKLPETGMRLQQDDGIKTAATDTAWLRFGIDQTVMLAEDSEVTVLPEDTQPGCTLRSGLLLCRIDKPLSNSRLFNVHAANVLFESKNAVFSVELTPQNHLNTYVFQGEVTVRASADTFTTLTKGQALLSATDDSLQSQKPTAIDYSTLPAALVDWVEDYADEASSASSAVPVSEVAPPPESSASDETSLPSQSSSAPPPLPNDQETASSSRSQVSESSKLPEQVEWDNAEPTPPRPIQVRFSYQWDQDSYKPFADIRWETGGREAYIDWQLCDSTGRNAGSSGRINSPSGNLRENNYPFATVSPLENGLFPKGYTLRLTAYVANERNYTALDPVIMQLPYFEMTQDEQDLPVPSTNIGVYFKHSYGSITITPQDSAFLVTGSFSPLKGPDVPLKLSVQFS